MKWVQIKEHELPALHVMAVIGFYEAFKDGATPIDMAQYLQTQMTLPQLQQDYHQVGTQFFGLKQDQTFIGYLKLNRLTHVTLNDTDYPKLIEIERIYLLPGYQNQGLGQQLMHLAEQIAQKEQVSLILTVYEKNDAGLRFYDRLGFREVDVKYVSFGQERRRCLILKKEV